MNTIDSLEARLRNDSGNGDLYYTLGKAYIKANRPLEAVGLLEKAAQLNPRNSKSRKIDCLLLIANVHLKHGKFIHAKNECQKVLQLEPSNIAAHRTLALVFEKHCNDLPRALHHYQKCMEQGGHNPHVARRIEYLRSRLRPPQQLIPQSASPAKRAGLPQTVKSLLRALDQARIAAAKSLPRFQVVAEKTLLSTAMFLVCLQSLRAFAILSPPAAATVSMAMATLTAAQPWAGVYAGLAIVVLLSAFTNALLGYLAGAGALLLLLAYHRTHPARAVLVLMVPLLAKMNLAYVIPLGAGLVLGPISAAALAAAACLAGLGYMAAGNIPQLGPLAATYQGVPIKISLFCGSVGDLFQVQWLQSLVSPSVAHSLEQFARSLYVGMPMIIVQISAWAAAGCAFSKLCQKRTLSRFSLAMAAAATVFLLQAAALELFGAEFPYWPMIVTLFLSGIVVAAVALATAPVPETPECGIAPTGWEAIGGLDDVKKEIQLVIEHQFDQTGSKMARKFDIKPARGVLFYGPPGCGKTMFAKVLATEAGAAFFSVKGSDFRSSWYGESEKNLSGIFQSAREKAPSIIFFDEIDHMLGKRENTLNSDSPEKQIVALFLQEMDGVKSLDNVLVVGATNEPDLLDPAVLRPGRFDKLIYIPLPDAKGREKIFEACLMSKPLADDLDCARLARLTERFSGADIADVCSKTAEQAMEGSVKARRTVKITQVALECQIKASKPSVSLKLLRKYKELREKYSRRTFKSETGDAEERKRYRWDQIGGLEEVRQQLIEAVEVPLKKAGLYEKFHIQPPKGVLLYGPPGCGKTLMAKIIADQCGAHFLSVDARKETGEGIKEWFIRARENTPAVLFFDEIDSIATSRDYGVAANSDVVTQLLIELDGTDDLKGVIAIAATNRPDRLDSALMRPGRFDRLIYTPPPDSKARLKILQIQLRDKPLSPDVDLALIARKTENYSGADLAALCYEVSMSLIRKSDREPIIAMADFLSALDKVKSSISPEELTYFEEMHAQYSRG